MSDSKLAGRTVEEVMRLARSICANTDSRYDKLETTIRALCNERDQALAGCHGYIADIHTCKAACAELIRIQGQQARELQELRAERIVSQRRIDMYIRHEEARRVGKI